MSQILNRKPATKSSDHKQEDDKSKPKSELIYKSVFKPKLSEKSTPKINMNDNKERSNEVSLTIPNESYMIDEKLDNKIKKNISDLPKSSSNTKNTKQYDKRELANEKILVFSDMFSKYNLNFEKEKKNVIISEKLTAKNINNLTNKEGKEQICQKTQDNQKNPGFSNSINTVKSFIQTMEKNNRLETFANKPEIKKSSLDFTQNKKNNTFSRNINKIEHLYKPMKNDGEIGDFLKPKNLEYYLKNGIFQTLNIEKTDSFYLFEILENIKFHFYVCESILEAKDELKLFLTSNTHYKTSKRILLLTNCKILL